MDTIKQTYSKNPKKTIICYRVRTYVAFTSSVNNLGISILLKYLLNGPNQRSDGSFDLTIFHHIGVKSPQALIYLYMLDQIEFHPTIQRSLPANIQSFVMMRIVLQMILRDFFNSSDEILKFWITLLGLSSLWNPSSKITLEYTGWKMTVIKHSLNLFNNNS